MNLKSKILAAGLAAIIAGGTIFGANCALAQTNNDNANSAIAQLQQMIETLKQQIQQIIALIAQLKPQETCGNGICRFGETAASCPADCNTTTASCTAEGEDVSANKPCCSGLTALNSCTKGSCSYSLPKKCAACGNGVCGQNETNQNCPQDCKYEKMTCAQACAQEGYLSAASYCNTWTLLPGQSSASTCAANEFGVGTTQDCNKNRVGGAYSDMTCCCNKQSAASIKVSANSLLSNYVYAGDKKVLIYSLNILANGSDMDVQRVTLQFSNAPYKYLGNIYLYSGNTLLASSPLNNSTVSTASNFDHEITLSNFSNKFVIPKGTAGRLDVKADVISPLAGVGAIAKMYVITAPNGIRAVDQSNVNHYGSESSETMGSMMIISNKPACGNNVCEAEASESTINCPADCQDSTACKTLWWSDNTSKICQQKQFCGAYMYLGLKTYNTQSACQTALDAACSKECVEKGYALGGNYCVANEYGVLEACCCTGTSYK